MKRLALVILSIALAAPLWAATPADTLKARLKELVPSKQPDSVQATPIAGIYEVTYGPEVFYFSADGRYLLRGDLIDLNSQVNLTEQRRASSRVAALKALGEDSMVVFAPKEGKARYTVTVFTDVDCPYCHKLHAGMAEMNALGIKVRYVAFPRAGIGSPTYKKMVSVWCADNQQQAMDDALAGKPVPEKLCKAHDLRDHMALVKEFQLTGTPALVLEDGTLVPGYVPPKQLLKMLEASEKSKAGK